MIIIANLFDWLQMKFGSKGQFFLDANVCKDMQDISKQIYIRELAFWSSVNMIANAVSKCEFKTFVNGKEIQGKEYYLWNYQPNVNQNSTEFLHKMICRLYQDNEVLVIPNNDQLFVADSFTKDDSVMKPIKFSDIQIDSLTMNKTFKANEVIYLKLYSTNMRSIINNLYDSYSELITSAITGYKWNEGKHGLLKVKTASSADETFKENYKNIAEKHLKPFFENNNSVMPVFEGYEYEDLSGKESRVQRTTRDIKAMIDDVFDFTAKGLNIPPVLTKGEVSGVEDAMDSLLTFCIDPLCDQITEEIVRKKYGYEGLSSGTYLQIDTTNIRHFDIFKNSQGVERLVSSGFSCINDIKKAIGQPIIDEPWAWQHFITKNFSTIQDLITLGGGEHK